MDNVGVPAPAVAMNMDDRSETDHDHGDLMSSLDSLDLHGGCPLNATDTSYGSYNPLVSAGPSMKVTLPCSPALSSSESSVLEMGASLIETFTTCKDQFPHHITIQQGPCELLQSEGENGDDELSDDDSDIDSNSRLYESDIDGDDACYSDDDDSETASDGSDSEGESDDGSKSDARNGKPQNKYADEDYEDLGLDDKYSFITFGRCVHFATTLESVIPTEDVDALDEPEARSDMTVHEKMALLMACEKGPGGFFRYSKHNNPEEHTPDQIDLDKRLLVAYINGLRTMPVPECRIVLQSRTQKHGTDKGVKDLSENTTIDSVNEYLDRMLGLILGLFPNLFEKGEYVSILNRAKDVVSFDEVDNVIFGPDSGHAQVFIKGLLEEKLESDQIFLANDVLQWFASELIEPLGRMAEQQSEH